ncbi:unnamed protein product [Prorocentrum cordatum]|uniref:Uncharacterized protein n=1 Tax=Prorocentrum cordatum TaxID=2364126 RepID=A0ABN9PUM7_9DINO|nr:unnamed protein product [Polarella glacialis]CAK0796896.1 unnamed protein product [Polarella glacialis]CAK0796903.1 unnamed protein product [Polarella glacialis]CAK0796909.1 unnamed protein product [Polarella glacialis]
MGKHGWHDLSRCRRWGQTKRTDQTTRSDRNGAATGQAEWSDRTVERRKLRRAAKGNRAFPRFSFRRKLSSMPRQPCQLSVQNERGSTPRPGLPSQALTRSSRSRRGSFRGPSQQTRSQSCRAARRAGWGEGGGRGRGKGPLGRDQNTSGGAAGKRTRRRSPTPVFAPPSRMVLASLSPNSSRCRAARRRERVARGVPVSPEAGAGPEVCGTREDRG